MYPVTALCQEDGLNGGIALEWRSFIFFLQQGLNVTPQQQQWITDHLGHTLDVHRIYYRATSDVIERVDVAKLLLMMDAGDISKYKGKKLDDIQFEGKRLINFCLSNVVSFII